MAKDIKYFKNSYWAFVFFFLFKHCLFSLFTHVLIDNFSFWYLISSILCKFWILACNLKCIGKDFLSFCRVFALLIVSFAVQNFLFSHSLSWVYFLCLWCFLQKVLAYPNILKDIPWVLL